MMETVMRPSRFIHALLIVVTAIMLIARFWLGLHRYIDPDEFAHLHWSFLLSGGSIPYKDFFMNFTPVYHALLSPLFLLPPTSSLLIIARILQFFLYGTSIVLVYRLGIHLSGSTTVSALGMVIYASFPMTLDKTLELRPDHLMMVLALFAFVVAIKGKSWTAVRTVSVGVLSGLSIVTLLKVIPMLPALTYLAWFKVPRGKRFGGLALFFISMILPAIAFILYQMAEGTLPLAYENIVHGSALIKKGEGVFSPWLSLSPYPLVYVTAGGVSIPWLFHALIWLAAPVGIWILWRQKRLSAQIITLVLIGEALSFLIIPTPYMQYFIPVSAFVSIAVSIAVSSGSEFLAKQFRWNARAHVVLVGVAFIALISFWYQYKDRINDTSAEQRSVIDTVLTISKPNETFYDMVGSYLLRPDGFYVCCNIYSQFAAGLSIPLPTLAQSLVKKQTKFIVLDRAGKSLWLPAPLDLAYVKGHYLQSRYPKIYTAGVQFLCQNTLCTQLGLDGNEIVPTPPRNAFAIDIPDSYRIETHPLDQTIIIDGVPVPPAKSIPLSRGIHIFSVPDSVLSLRVTLDR